MSLMNHRERFVIGYDAFYGGNHGLIHTILPCNKSADAAIKALDGAPLFDRRIRVGPFQRFEPHRAMHEVEHGWYAAKSSHRKDVNRRHVPMIPPTDGTQRAAS
jgi:hypothetical protein